MKVIFIVQIIFSWMATDVVGGGLQGGASYHYFKQSKLMLRMIPYLAEESCFALKGGAAINFFYRDMPRFPKDIDLTYLPIEEREISLMKMSQALQRIASSAKKIGLHIHESCPWNNRIIKIFITDGVNQIRIEPNEVIRGTVYAPLKCQASQIVESAFETSASMQVVQLADLYAGKLCAAMDRQHPRDLFDVKILLENEGITDKIRKAFVIYLACHHRPIHELIDPKRKNIFDLFQKEFIGITDRDITYEDLILTREICIHKIQSELTLEERKFLFSLKEGNPRWSLLEIPGVEDLPAIQWKLLNIRKMDKVKHLDSLNKLRKKLNL